MKPLPKFRAFTSALSGCVVMGENEIRNPACFFEEAAEGRMRALSESSADGDPRIVIAIADRQERSLFEFKYWIDVERGFLPTRMEFFGGDGTLGTQLESASIQDFDGMGWILMKSLKVSFPRRSPPFHVRRYDVVELEVGEKVRSYEFELTIPKETRVHVVGSGAAFVLPKEESLRLADIPSLKERASLALPTAAPAPSTLRLWPWFVNGALLLAVALDLMIRRKRRGNA